MQIIFSDSLPEKYSGNYVHYYNLALGKENLHRIDLKPIINSEIESWIEQLNIWHGKCCQEGLNIFPNWWLNEASRIMAWLPNINQNLFFAIAISKYIKENKVEKVLIIKAPRPAQLLLRDQFSNISLAKPKPLPVAQKFKNKLRPYKMVFDMFRRLIKARNTNLPTFKEAPNLIYSHLINSEIFRHSGDHFFGKMFNNIGSDLKGNLIWLFFSSLGNLNEERASYRELKKTTPNSFIIQDFNTLRNAFKVLCEVLTHNRKVKLLRETIPTVKIDDFVFPSFSKLYIENTLQNKPPIIELQIKLAFKNIHSKIKVNSIFYPFEDKGIERAIIQASKKIRTVGYAHAVHHIGHLYLKDKPEGLPNSQKPDIIACTGVSAIQWLTKKQGIDSKSLVPVGTKRFHEPTLKQSFKKNGTLKLLLLVGQGYEITTFANYIEEDPKVFENCELTIRQYPFGFFEEQKEGIKRLESLGINITLESKSLEQQIEECDIALFGSTSAGYEAILKGRVSIYLDIHHIVPLNSIESKGNEQDILQAKNITELATIVSKIKKLSLPEYLELSAKQINFAKQVYSPLCDKTIKGILKS